MKGLIGRHGLSHGEGLLIEPCNSIHTFFMRFPIDAVFYDRDKVVTAVYRRIKPWRVTGIISGAKGVLELPAEGSCNVDYGDRLVVV
ncbi:MAG: DUF192 domain-containing protein [Firmicutes bacterium]|nr:DUF192 domain-containing protein [Bacillota bacterium]